MEGYSRKGKNNFRDARNCSVFHYDGEATGSKKSAGQDLCSPAALHDVSPSHLLACAGDSSGQSGEGYAVCMYVYIYLYTYLRRERSNGGANEALYGGRGRAPR